jgi:tRNA-dihydrouridine synthase
MGRAACHNTWALRDLDQKVFCEKSYPMKDRSRHQLMEEYLCYAEDMQVVYK